jgi:hypothetical protein
MNIIEDFLSEIYRKSNHIITLDDRNSRPVRQLSARRRPPADATLVPAHCTMHRATPADGGHISLMDAREGGKGMLGIGGARRSSCLCRLDPSSGWLGGTTKLLCVAAADPREWQIPLLR